MVECFFLHDSDIIFRKLPNFDSLINDDDYLSYPIPQVISDIIILWIVVRVTKVAHPTSNKGQLLKKWLMLLVCLECIECNQENSGGGQYLIKNTIGIVEKNL
jgi:hypothetical protein